MPRGRRGKDVLLDSAELVGWALGGLEREIAATRARLSALTAQAGKLRSRLGAKGRRVAGAAVSTASDIVTNGRKRRRMSAEARKRISEMMKKRWAERRRKGTAGRGKG
jgi:hypothetical protein